jgi:hypothetical protein
VARRMCEETSREDGKTARRQDDKTARRQDGKDENKPIAGGR